MWGPICDLIGKPEWKTDPDYATPPARLPRLKHIFNTIEEWTKTKTKFEVMDICNKHDIPVGPILSMKEIAEEKSLRDTGTVVEVDHPGRGKYLTVGNPVKMSDSITEEKRSPLLGEHTEEILSKVLGYSAQRSRRDQAFRRDHAAGEARQGRGGVAFLHPSFNMRSERREGYERGGSRRLGRRRPTRGPPPWPPHCFAGRGRHECGEE